MIVDLFTASLEDVECGASVRNGSPLGGVGYLSGEAASSFRVRC
jgi:hypothetical protein